MNAAQAGEGVLECGRKRMTRVVCESGHFAVWKRAVPRNRMREIFTYGSVGAVIRSPETWSNPRGWEPKVQCEPLRTCWACGCGPPSNSHPQGA